MTATPVALAFKSDSRTARSIALSSRKIGCRSTVRIFPLWEAGPASCGLAAFTSVLRPRGADGSARAAALRPRLIEALESRVR
jgi:hypothetical protein